MDLDELTEELHDLSLLKNNWYSVADTIETYRGYLAGHPQIIRQLKDVYEANGFSQNAINRMLAVKSFYDATKNQVRELEGVDPNTLPFTSLEISKRLYQVNPSEGLVMLADVAKGNLTSRALRERYDALVAANSSAASLQQISKRAAAEFEETALDHASKAADLLFGGSKKVSFHSPLEQQLQLTISAVVKVSGAVSAPTTLYGLDLFYFRDQENFKKRIDSFLYRLVFNASFFTTIWAIIPSGTGEVCENALSSILDLQDRQNIGVATVPWREDEKNSIKIIRRPKHADITETSDKLYRFTQLHSQLEPIERV